jgi:hypothetical protein
VCNVANRSAEPNRPPAVIEQVGAPGLSCSLHKRTERPHATACIEHNSDRPSELDHHQCRGIPNGWRIRRIGLHPLNEHPAEPRDLLSPNSDRERDAMRARFASFSAQCFKCAERPIAIDPQAARSRTRSNRGMATMKSVMPGGVALALGICAASEVSPTDDTRFTAIAGVIAGAPLVSAPAVILLTGTYIEGRRV